MRHLLREVHSRVFRLVLTQDLRELRVVDLVSLVIGANHLVPALAHLIDGEGSVLEN
jgi:hypothetical protein